MVSCVRYTPVSASCCVPVHMDCVRRLRQRGNMRGSVCGGVAFERHEVLMAILREDLFVAFFTAARSSNLATLSNVCQVALSLYAHLGSHLLLQV